MIPSKVQIYRSHFFLNFLCGVLYILISYIMSSIPYEDLSDHEMLKIAFVTPVVIVIIVLIQANHISYKRFKQYNIKISRVIYPALTYVGFTMPFAILLLILFIMHRSSPKIDFFSW